MRNIYDSLKIILLILSSTLWSIAAPPTPSSPTLTVLGTNGIQASWGSSSGADNFHLYRATSSSGSYTQIYWGPNRTYTDQGNHLSADTTYYYKVSASDASGESALSSSRSARTQEATPSTPSSPTLTVLGTNGIQASWGSSSGADNYHLYRATSSNGSYTQIYWGPNRNYTDQGNHLSANTTYYYKVSASNTSGESARSSSRSARTQEAIPATPSSPTLTVLGTNGIQASWGSSSGADNYHLYRATSSGGSYTQIYWGPNLNYTDQGNHLSANTTYYYKVSASNSTGESARSSSRSARTQEATPSTPPTPGALALTVIGTNGIQASWGSSTGASNYHLYRSTSSSGSYTQIYWGPNRNYTDQGNHLSANTTYYYKVSASNNSGESGQSSSQNARTSSPTGPQAPNAPTLTVLSANGIRATWNSTSGITNYRLFRSSTLNGTYTQIYWGPNLSYTDQGNHLSADTTYFYQLSVENALGESPRSTSSNAKTENPDEPPAPSAPTLLVLGPNGIRASWNSTSGATNYRLFRSTTLNGTYTQIYWGPDRTYFDEGDHLSPNTTYFYQLSADTNEGESQRSSSSSITTSPPPGPATPLAPALEVLNSSGIQITWLQVDGAINYRLFRATEIDGDYTQVYWGPDLEYDDLGPHLSPNTEYSYRLKTENNEGESNASDASTVRTALELDPYQLADFERSHLLSKIPEEFLSGPDLETRSISPIKDIYNNHVTKNKIVILFHGWNPEEKSPAEIYTGAWDQLIQGWERDKDTTFKDWQLIPIYWSTDAATGGNILSAPKKASFYAYQHGLLTAKKLSGLDLSEITIIGWSAGSWGVLSCTRAISWDFPLNTEIQAVYLDPYIPGNGSLFGAGAYFNTFELSKLDGYTRSLSGKIPFHSQSYYTKDETDAIFSSTTPLENWGQSTGVNQVNIDGYLKRVAPQEEGNNDSDKYGRGDKHSDAVYLMGQSFLDPFNRELRDSRGNTIGLNSLLPFQGVVLEAPRRIKPHFMRAPFQFDEPIDFTWHPAEGATKYEVFIRRNTTSPSRVRLGETNLTEFTFSGTLEPGNWVYEIVAVSADGLRHPSTFGHLKVGDKTDIDNDGLDDHWEVRYFASISAAAAFPWADPDGDGDNNATEFLNNTDPTSRASRFVVELVAPGSTSQVTDITFGPVDPAVTYEVQKLNQDGEWEKLPEDSPVYDRGTVRTICDVNLEAATKALYRVTLSGVR
ncbi:MAG: fibronectin type III domain-containing protein [Verrucomicrobiaceae bacterium]